MRIYLVKSKQLFIDELVDAYDLSHARTAAGGLGGRRADGSQRVTQAVTSLRHRFMGDLRMRGRANGPEGALP